ncbi:cysteine proteinase COT44-like [Bidens hawaiensis]|uniref:cysteine proteinase COT44-like n=1 Tax=Bidens hawaiensis TaxID=980011 RepID=UPI004049C85B
MADHGHQEDAADSVDWRQCGVVGKVKDQGKGCVCWSFGAIAAIESANFLHTKKMISLFEQFLIDCDKDFNKGFAMGQVKKAFKFIIKYGGGVPSEEEYPFKGEKGTCKVRHMRVAAKIHGYKDVPSCDEEALKEAVRKQPVTAEIDCTKIKKLSSPKEIVRYIPVYKCNHNVLIVGFGRENGIDYWIIKGSWGDKWGDGGYLRLERNVTDPKGTVGISTRCYYPLIKGFNM